MSDSVKYAALADLGTPSDGPIRGEPAPTTTYSEVLHSTFAVLDNDGNPFDRAFVRTGLDSAQAEVPKVACICCHRAEEEIIRPLQARGLRCQSVHVAVELAHWLMQVYLHHCMLEPFKGALDFPSTTLHLAEHPRQAARKLAASTLKLDGLPVLPPRRTLTLPVDSMPKAKLISFHGSPQRVPGDHVCAALHIVPVGDEGLSASLSLFSSHARSEHR